MKNQIVSLVKMQDEQIAWSLRNFGQQPAHRPMLGIVEELCELEEAQLIGEDEYLGGVAEYKKDVLDAVGDIGIYMLDYCGKRGWSMDELWEARACPEWLEDFVMGDDNEGYPYFAPFIRRLAHSQLKGEQNIRGGQSKHDEILKITLSSVLWVLEGVAKHVAQRDFLSVIAEVWAKVRQRDWVANPDTAHEVAEVQP